MDIVQKLTEKVKAAVKELYEAEVSVDQVLISATRKEFEGDYTLVVFPFAKQARKKPEAIGEEIGDYLKGSIAEIEDYNVIKGFLNLVLTDAFWLDFLQQVRAENNFGYHPRRDEKVMIEFSSPNTNKPLHLGHIRNILLGWSVHKICEAAGYQTVRVQIVNDRGIAICKSMLAWKKYGDGATPASEGVKPDHFVGHYYVLFEQKFREEYLKWRESDEARAIFREKGIKDQGEEKFFAAFKNTYFNEYSRLGAEAKDLLRKWEADDPDTLALWRQMNHWVYDGFEQTYEQLGVQFDKLYYESETYQLGKDIIREGLEKGIFYEKQDGSVWIDLEDIKLDHKLVLRSDGTSVYMTQDIGTALLRYRDFGVDRMVYVVADEQNYHFQVLFEILKRLELPFADGLHHLSYGMVDLPTGKMKSRDGTVVDADDLIAEVVREADKSSRERGEIADLPAERQQQVIRKIGMAALKFFIIKVHPQKRMTFDPKESVDLQGQTGPYVQNAFVRIQSVRRKAADIPGGEVRGRYENLKPGEKELLREIQSFPQLILQAAEEFDPSLIANYCYNLAKTFHKFYHDHSILRAETEAARTFRLQLSEAVADVLERAMDLLGIDMPERM
ncbi:MAG: arginine--tRNA ligase [Saprospiraceae bacterium]|nr:arginine--tRNA ligase [Saprospiraceae bacterium]